MWTTSAVAILAFRHARTVHLKIVRNRSSPSAGGFAPGSNGAVAAHAGHNRQPANGDVDLSLTHQLAIVHDAARRSASISRTAASGSMPGRPLFTQ